MGVIRKIVSVLNKDREFYQAKYKYYEKLVCYIIIASYVTSFLYWCSDCWIAKDFLINSLIIKLSAFIALPIYVCIIKKCNKYTVGIISAYVVAHIITISTCMSVYTANGHENENLLVLEGMFIFLGLAAPKTYSKVFHSLFLIDILLTNLVIHYNNIETIIITHTIIIIATEVLIAYTERVYRDKYNIDLSINYIILHDNLTDAYNRNIFKSICYPDTNILNIESAGILILDIDFFKKINDTYGHDVGDEVLKTLAEILRHTIRSSDYLIRYGGEEFVIILNNVDRDILLDTGKRINNAVIKGLIKYRVTVSIGGCMYDDLTDYVSAIKLADEQLYYVKEHGRNNVKVV